jgi:hypothetical protein
MTKHLNSLKSELDRSYATTQQCIEELRKYRENTLFLFLSLTLSHYLKCTVSLSTD